MITFPDLAIGLSIQCNVVSQVKAAEREAAVITLTTNHFVDMKRLHRDTCVFFCIFPHREPLLLPLILSYPPLTHTPPPHLVVK